MTSFEWTKENIISKRSYIYYSFLFCHNGWATAVSNFMWFSCGLYRKYSGLFFLDIANRRVKKMKKKFFFHVSALIKQVNKSIDGTADDEDEGVPTDRS